MSTIGWEGPRIDLPRGSYQFRRLGTKDLTKLLGVWFGYQRKTAAGVATEGLTREEFGRSLYEVFASEPEDLFGWAFGTLTPLDGAKQLEPSDVEDAETIPLWFLTTYITGLLDHEDFARFFGEFSSLLAKDGKLMTLWKTRSGPSKAARAGKTKTSSESLTLG
ncbi:MAG: hypothetical protein M0R22_01075 [Dehalococcoidia bacterium]|nr:hypothetical protein [Dehalococcoidia bacterium]